jgi:NADP-dependent 3-hydroxy acid dehydrogenase YdfG
MITGFTSGTKVGPALTVYSATKAAVRDFARSWIQDLKGRGITITRGSASSVCRRSSLRS